MEPKVKAAPKQHMGIRCGFCKDILFSWSGHDFKKCWCGKTFVDGGFDYLRWGGEGMTNPQTLLVHIQINKVEEASKWFKGNTNAIHTAKASKRVTKKKTSISR
jgi:hypothetical protein